MQILAMLNAIKYQSIAFLVALNISINQWNKRQMSQAPDDKDQADCPEVIREFSVCAVE